ncbi:MAG: integration host factor subunit beta [Alphaproteobacteria bacterium]|nr:MAG: integration host factor subunit beta [Alphaproteobacteria bacterium]
MIRSDLIRLLVENHPELSLREVEQIVDLVFNKIVATLRGNGRVELRGFGTFQTVALDSRIRRDPRTGDEVDVAAKRVPRFKPSRKLIGRINGWLLPARVRGTL